MFNDEKKVAPDGGENGEFVDNQMVATHDAVFGELTEDGPNYRNVPSHPTYLLVHATNLV